MDYAITYDITKYSEVPLQQDFNIMSDSLVI